MYTEQTLSDVWYYFVDYFLQTWRQKYNFLLTIEGEKAIHNVLCYEIIGTKLKTGELVPESNNFLPRIS